MKDNGPSRGPIISTILFGIVAPPLIGYVLLYVAMSGGLSDMSTAAGVMLIVAVLLVALLIPIASAIVLINQLRNHATDRHGHINKRSKKLSILAGVLMVLFWPLVFFMPSFISDMGQVPAEINRYIASKKRHARIEQGCHSSIYILQGGRDKIISRYRFIITLLGNDTTDAQREFDAMQSSEDAIKKCLNGSISVAEQDAAIEKTYQDLAAICDEILNRDTTINREEIRRELDEYVEQQEALLGSR